MCHWRSPMCGGSRGARETSFAVQPGSIDRAMAVHAPAHAQVLNLADALHRLHRSMALLASHACIHMRTMVEVNEIGEVMNFDPLNRPWLLVRIRFHLIVDCESVIDFLNFR